MNQKLKDLTDRYEKLGTIKGNILLMRLEVALQFLDELQQTGVGVGLIELWLPIIIEGREYFKEDPFGPDFGDLDGKPDYAVKSIEAAKHYIQHELPPGVTRVSFILDTDEPYWENLHTRQYVHQSS